MRKDMIDEKERDDLVKFIYSREQPEGGFSFSEMTPSTLEDTYFALRLLEELDKCSVSKTTILYIRSLNINDIKIPKHFYQVTNIYRIADLPDKLKIVKDRIIFNNKIILNTLADLYYLVLTKEYLNMPITPIENERNILTLAQKRNVKSMEEYKQLVTIMKKLRISFQQKEYSQSIRASQNPDGGFGLVTNSTSFLEPTYHALHALKELDTTPKDTHECKRFVYSCMTRISGFGRQTVTVPSLEYSYYAIVSLKIIDMMKKSRLRRQNDVG